RFHQREDLGWMTGQGEADDVVSICDYLRSRSDAPKSIVLCGYSYGSVAAGAVTLKIPELAGFISISYPCGVLWFLTLFNSSKLKNQLAEIPAHVPKLFVTGTKDSFTSEATFQKFVAELPTENRSVVIVNEATHFWLENENALVGHVNQWMGKCGLNSKAGQASADRILKMSPSVVATGTLSSASSSRVQSPVAYEARESLC
ncbi:hypothetical protein HKX48_000990, partial [Thoreauomyces humboldtii]